MSNPLKWGMWFNVVLSALDFAGFVYWDSVALLLCSVFSGCAAVVCYYMAKSED